MALEEGPARAQEREPRIQAEVAWQEAASGLEPRAAVVQTRKSWAEVDRVPAAVREATTAVASGVALSLAMKVAMAPAVDQAPAPEQAAAEMAVEAQPETVAEAEERGLVSGSPEKKESTAFCAR